MRRHSFTGCDRKDSEVSRFALACSTSRTRISCAHPAILNVRETEDLEPVCPGLRLKSLRWATPVKSLRRPGSHNRPGQQTYPRSKLQRVYIICKTLTPWLHSGPTVPSAACRRGLVFPTSWPGNVRELRNLVEVLFVDPPPGLVSLLNLPDSFRRIFCRYIDRATAERDRIIAALY